MQLFFPSAPGAEPLLEAEIRRCFPHLQVAPCIGGVELMASIQDVAPLCRGLRCALGGWWRFAEFPARHFGQLQKELKKLDFEAVLGTQRDVALKVSTKRSRLYHSGAIAQRFFENSGLQLAAAPEEAIKLHLRIFRDQASLSVDLVGGLLPKRGWRKETAKAPLRKDLAAMLLRASGWRPGRALLDPMCGSGTLPIEAARASAGYWPNGLRSMDFTRLPALENSALPAGEREAIMPAEGCADWPAQPSLLIGMDHNEGALAIAARNEVRAGVEGIRWQRQQVGAKAKWELPEGCHVVCNPPYGQRIANKKKLISLYAELGRLVAESGSASRFACIAPRGPWIDALGLELVPLLATDFGGLSVTLYAPPATAIDSP